MKFKIIIDQQKDEEIVVYAKSKTPLIEEIERLCQWDGIELVGYGNRETVKLNLNEIYCFVSENNKVYAITKENKYMLKCRLYNLEETLDDGFIKINQSCIANLKKIERFETTLYGALNVRFKNGYIDYVSRRNLKKVKERFGC